MLKGDIILKGDKSITHRVIMMSSIKKCFIKINNPSNCVDVYSTIKVLNQCGANIIYSSNSIINDRCINKSPKKVLYCGNSGTTARLLIGLLFGMKIAATIDGDSSLRRRPMDRVLKPLEKMNLKYKSNHYKLPIDILASEIDPVEFTMNIPSAQVKSAILFACIGVQKKYSIVDNFNTRDHTERMIDYFSNKKLNNSKQSPFIYSVPGDISNAAFLVAAAVCIKGSDLLIKNTLYNATRMGFIDTLIDMGANIHISNIRDNHNEQICDIHVKYNATLKSVNIDKTRVVTMIDELPAYAIVACFVSGISKIINAEELRIKESDRIAEICTHLSMANVDIIETKDGFVIDSKNKLYNTINIKSKDHRIIMALEVFNLIINGNCSNKFQDEISISFPDFYNCVQRLIK